MTKIIQYLVIVAIVLVSTLVSAQNFQGKAYYQTKRAFEVSLDSTKIEDAQQKAIKEMLKKQFEKTYILTFNKTASLYKVEEKLDVPKPNASGMIITISGSNNVLYKNTKENIYVDAQEVFSKKFLVKDKLKNWDWKMEKETKQIGNYLCFKATATLMVDAYDDMGLKKETQKELPITAWYTPEIPISNGPKDYNGLPGLILELHEGKMHYVCNKIVMNPKEKIVIEAPKKGKVMTEKAFKKMHEKKQKEMMENFHNGRKKGEKGQSFSISIGG